MVYEIVVEGRVEGVLSRALEGFKVVPGAARETSFRGCVKDHAALHAVLQRIADHNMVLTSVRQVDGSLEDSTKRG